MDVVRPGVGGVPFFGATSDKKRLELTDSMTVGDGIIILTYNSPT